MVNVQSMLEVYIMGIMVGSVELSKFFRKFACSS